MTFVNKNHFILFVGIKGIFTRYDTMYNFLYLYNINHAIWVSPIIAGIQTGPRLGFSFCNNYEKIEILILGEIMKENKKEKLKQIIKLNIQYYMN